MRPARQRELVDDVRAIWRVSIRRACRNLRVDPSSYHYKSRRPSQASLKQRIKEIAETRVRYHAPRASEVPLPTFSVKSGVVIVPEEPPNASTINSAVMPVAS